MNDEHDQHVEAELGDDESAGFGRPVRDPARRKKLLLGLAVLVAVWIAAMIYQAMQPPEIQAERDEVGRPKGGLVVSESKDPKAPVPASPGTGPSDSPRLADLLNEIERLDKSVWAKEVEAERHGAAIVKFWDDLRAAEDPISVIVTATESNITLGSLGAAEDAGLGIRRVAIGKPPKPHTLDAFRKLLAGFRASGYAIEQTEWRHVEFSPAASGAAARSIVDMRIDAHGPQDRRRVSIRGEIKIDWADQTPSGRPAPTAIDASELTLTVRDAPPAFVESFSVTDDAPKSPLARQQYRHVWPIVLDDLDADGLPELILAGRNRVYRNLGGGRFDEPRPLSPPMPRIASVGLVADFSGDGQRDFLTVDGAGQLQRYDGDGKGGFAAVVVVVAKLAVRMPVAMTAGDVDGDGDLDVFLGQYKHPWIEGQMATPYYDANDGEPAYLLRNDGDNFADITESSGLAAKRNRRTLGAALVDLTDDGHLDLVVASDFAGVDLYRGDGAGRFEDVTATLLPERHGLSAALTLADYDGDGRLDVFAAAECSPVVRRLDRLGIGRTDKAEATKMRSVMGYGNRMFLARDGRFEASPFAGELANTGAPQCCTSLDVENDGDVDVYVANGLHSGRSAKDIASNFWRHGIYIGDSTPDTATELLYAQMFIDPLRRGGESRGGFQHNALLLNRGQRGYLDAAYALGVAHKRDALAVLAGDVDNDGRVDLILMDHATVDGFPLETVRVLRNTLEGADHWIGVRIHNSAKGHSPIGARATVHVGGAKRIALVVTGDSFRSQHGPVVHFGLGAAAAVDKIDIRWADGSTQSLARPAIDRYHDVGKQAEAAAAATP